MKRSQIAQYSVSTVLLVFALARCSPLAQSIPKVGNRANVAEDGTTLSLPGRPAVEAAPASALSAASSVLQDVAWVDVSRYRESSLSARLRAATVELTPAQLLAWADHREVVAFQLPADERIERASVVFRMNLSAEQIQRAEISQIQVTLVPSTTQPGHWSLRIVTGKESAIVESLANLERVTLRLVGPDSASELHPAAPAEASTEESTERE